MNLDCDYTDGMDLIKFSTLHQNGRGSRDLFPEGGKDTRRATTLLALYAGNKGTAMLCRERGDVPTALYYERICDGIYQKLPNFARW